MDASLPFDDFGGRMNAEQGQLLTAQDVDRIGAFSVTSLLNVLALLFWDVANDVALSGFPRERLATDACLVSSTSALGFSVSTGWGLFWNASATSDDFEPYRYRPMVLDTAYAASLTAHDATNPRIDVVCMAPAWEDDVGEARNVKNPSTGVVSSTSINARRKFSSTIQVVTGTPSATPAVPAVPSGYVELARAAVPASTGAAVWEDTRPVLELGHLFKGLPRHAVDDYVPTGEADELEVLATSPASLAVTVTGGRASINGVVRYYPTSTVTLSAAHATLDRIDLISAYRDGSIVVTAGTASATPAAPALPANSCALATVLVEATVTSVSNAKITDLRDREPFDGTNRLQKASTNWDRMDTPAVFVKLGSPTISGGGREASIPFELFYPDGVTEYAGPFDDGTGSGGVKTCAFMLEIYTFWPVYSGAATLSGTAWSGTQSTTDFSTGGATDVTRLSPHTLDGSAVGSASSFIFTEAALAWFKPTNFDADNYNRGGGPSASGRLLFWCPERTGAIKLTRSTSNPTFVEKMLLVVRPVDRPGGCTANRIVEFT